MKIHPILCFLLSLFLTGGSLVAQTIMMRVPDTTAVSGNMIDIPIYADNTLTGNNVYSYSLQLTFNQNILQVVSVITAGTISNAFGAPVVNTTVPGYITLVNAGTAPLSGSGKFIYIRFKALQPGGVYINFTTTQYNYFNEGIPAMAFDNGYLSVNPAPGIIISPNNGLIAKGEQLQFYVSGGTSPYQWFVTNGSIASINSTGLLTATGYGSTKTVVVDNGGLRDTTNDIIDIRAMRLSIPNNLSQWQGQDIDVPINTTSLTGLNIYSGTVTLNFNSNILSPVSVIQTGSMISSYPAATSNFSIPGAASVAFAGTTALSGSGTLFYLRFHVSTHYAGSCYLDFASALLNETFVPVFTSGYFTTINLPVLSISPNSGTLVAGQSQQFVVNGGATPPVTWSVNDPTIATINSGGLVSTIKGGIMTVSAVDAHGATATSGNWLIYDTQIIMPDTTICPAAGVFYYPVFIRSLPAGQSVYSVESRFTYNSTYLTFQQVESTGTLTQGWTSASNPQTGAVTIACSGATPFTGAGTIFLLKFGLNGSFVAGINAGIQVSSITLNQGVPNPQVDIYGSISGVNPASASVTIAASPTGAVCPGTSITFTATPVNGGIPSYQWKKNGSVLTGETNQTYTSSSLANGDIITCVLTPTGPCASGSPATSNPITVAITPLPSAAGTISGPVLVVPGQTGIGYSIAPVANATSYLWVVPDSWIITSGQGTASLVVTAGAVAGSIQVTPLNSCGSGAQGSLAVGLTGSKPLNITLMLEGLFNTGTNQMNKAQNSSGDQFPGSVADKITVEIRQGTSPYALVQTFGNIDLLTTGSSSLSVPSTMTGSYYLAIRHRNSIETWSASPVSFSGGSISFNFTTSASQAYGSNLTHLGTKYCLFGGDENQDGLVDSTDMIDLDNASATFASGYLATDVNGDGLVDSSDMILVDNNANAFVGTVHP